MSHPRSRYAVVSRRALLKGGASLGAIALVPGIACATSDAEVFAGAVADRDQLDASPNPSPLPTTAPVAPQSPSAAPVPSAPADPAQAQPTVTPEPTGAPTPAPAAIAVAQGNQAVVEFTYTQAEGGKNLSPYIAVWIEDAAGGLVATVALWYQQTGRGERWLPDLKRWYTVDQERVEAGGKPDVDVISAATRLPGEFSVVWDGLTHDGASAVAGDFFVCIEAARERGPYSLIREPLRLEAQPVSVTLGDQGELSAASVTANG